MYLAIRQRGDHYKINFWMSLPIKMGVTHIFRQSSLTGIVLDEYFQICIGLLQSDLPLLRYWYLKIKKICNFCGVITFF